MKQLLNWFRREKLERGLDQELRYHLDRRISDLIGSGLPDGEARRQAMLELGGLVQVQEEVRDVWLTRWLRDFAHDLRYAARSFLRSPAFTITGILSLALGIGATTAIYSLVDQVVLHALPVRQPERLVLIDWKGPFAGGGFGSWNLMSYPICRDLQKQERIFEGVLCRATTTVNLSIGREPEPVVVEMVSGSYFSVLGVGPTMGRVLGLDDDATPEAGAVVVLSYDFWKTKLGGAPDAVGRKLVVNQHPMTVVGVAAEGFRGIDVGEVPVMWMPAAMSSAAIPGFKRMLDRRTRWMQVLGRLQPNVSLQQAQSGVQPWFKTMLEEDTRLAGFPPMGEDRRQRFLHSTLVLTPAPQGHSGLRRNLSQPLWVLLAATGVLLGLACLNVAGLFLARGSAREREIGTRLALGASRGRIGRQLLADSVLLALAGGTLGVLLAPVAMRTLIAFLPQDTASNALRATVDPGLLLFALGVSGAAGMLSGFAPALQAGRRSLIASLRERGGPAFGAVRLRKAIVTMQIAFTLILVIGAGLFIRTLTELMAKGPGFQTHSLISFGLDPARNGYTQEQGNRLVERIHEEIRGMGSMEASAIARFQLLTGGSWNEPMTILTDRRTTTDRDVNLNAVTPGFFATLGIKLLAGRDFEERDPRTAIVNEAFAKQYLGGRNVLGAHIGEGDGPDAKPDIEVIGVVANFSYRGLREDSPQAYFPISESGAGGGSFYLKVRGTPEEAAQSIRAIVRKADPGLPVSYFRTLDEQVSRSLNKERMLATLSGGFGMLALLLSLVGLYGVMSYVVTQRTREIGIRLALGATRGSAIWMVLRDALMMIAAGAAIALPCAGALGRLVESQLFGVRPMDPAAMIVATVVLTVAAMLAALIPAYRASAVDPTVALRFE